MTTDDTDAAPEDIDALKAAAAVLRDLTDRLARVLPLLNALAAEVADAWRDAHGQEWAERAGHLRTALARDLDDATTAARDVAALLPPGAARGARLPETWAERTDDTRGMRLALLDEPG